MRIVAKVMMVAGLFVLAGITRADADPIIPAQCPILMNAGSVSQDTPYNTIRYFQGDTISLTNSYLFTSTTNYGAAQNLDGVTIRVTVGVVGDVANFTGYNINTNTGCWGANVICPTQDPWYLEARFSNVNVRTVGRYLFRSQAKLSP